MSRNGKKKERKLFLSGHYVFWLFRFCFLIFVDAQINYNTHTILRSKRSNATFLSGIHAQAAKQKKNKQATKNEIETIQRAIRINISLYE